MSFPITCTACLKTFTISDEIYEKKVAGRVVTIKCKSCSQGIRVDGTKGVGAPAPAAPVPAAPEPAPVAAPAGEPLWAVDYPDGQDREFTTAEVIAELERGAVNGTTLVWRDGMAEWLEVHQVPELAGELTRIEAKKKAAAMAAAKAAAIAPVHKPRAPMPTVTGLAGLPGAGVSIKQRPAAAVAATPTPAPAELPKPRAQQPSAPALATPLPKPRAQQPSTPAVATPLPKPRAQQPSAPALATPLPKPRAQAPSGSDDLTPVPKPRAQMPSGPDLQKPRGEMPSTPELPKPRAQMPSAPVLPQPKLAVAAPPPAPPPVAAPPPAPPPIAAPTPPPTVTQPLPVVAAPAALAPQPPVTPPPPFVAPPAPLPVTTPMFDATPPLPASVAKVVSRPPQVQPAFPMSAPMASTPGPVLVADHASVEWPEAKKKTPLIVIGVLAVVAIAAGAIVMLGGKDDVPPSAPITALPASPATPTPSPAATPTSAAARSGAESATGSDPVPASPDPGATPGAGFAELFAAGARKAESKGATVAPTSRFDPAATKAPLAQAASDAQACKQSGGPTGKVTVVVTFDPSGKVSSATITDPPFAGTATAVCISSALKRASIAPFSGLPGTVSKTFSIL